MLNKRFRKRYRLRDNVGKIEERGSPHIDNITHAHCMQKYTLTICNTYCFSTVTMVARPVSILRYTYIACIVPTTEVSLNATFTYASYTDMTGMEFRTLQRAEMFGMTFWSPRSN